VSVTHERLLEVLHYAASTGVFTWRISRGTRAKGSEAGRRNTSGHRQIKLDGRNYLAHRLAWFYVHGVWPADETDHEDGVKDNNCLLNLREATHSQNQHNQRSARRDSKSGLRGVSLYRDGRWTAEITIEHKRYYLGRFASKELAKEFRDLAAGMLQPFSSHANHV